MRPFLLASTLVLLASCTNDRLDVATPPQIVVKREVVVVVALDSRGGLSSRGYDSIERQFADPAVRGAREPVHAMLANMDARTREDVVALLRRLGVARGNIEISNGTSIKDRTGGLEPSLVLSRYKAIPPDCGQRVLVAGLPRDNTTDGDFGCATLVDLALTVDDPRDLLGRPGVILADGERAARPVGAYRRFNAPPPEPARPVTTQ